MFLHVFFIDFGLDGLFQFRGLFAAVVAIAAIRVVDAVFDVDTFLFDTFPFFTLAVAFCICIFVLRCNRTFGIGTLFFFGFPFFAFFFFAFFLGTGLLVDGR